MGTRHKKKTRVSNNSTGKSKHTSSTPDFIDEAFIRFPPEMIEMSFSDWKRRAYPGLDLITDLSKEDPGSASDIRYEVKRFAKTKDPLSLLHAFVSAVTAGVYPDIGVLHELTARIKVYLEGNGRISMDTALGINRRGPGSSFTRREQFFMTKWKAEQVYSLKTGFGFSTAEAAERVSWFLERQDGRLGRTYTKESIEDLYSRRWKREFGLDELDLSNLANPNNTLDPWDQLKRKTFLKSFPNPAEHS